MPKNIPDSNPTGAQSVVWVPAGLGGGTVARATIVIGSLTHTFDGDLDISLTSPGGSVFDLSSDNGSSGANYTNTVLDSTCGPNVTGGSAPFSGCYKPEASLAPLVGTAPFGKWTLHVVDDAGSDTGTLSTWGVVLCTTP